MHLKPQLVGGGSCVWCTSLARNWVSLGADSLHHIRTLLLPAHTCKLAASLKQHA